MFIGIERMIHRWIRKEMEQLSYVEIFPDSPRIKISFENGAVAHFHDHFLESKIKQKEI